MTPRTIQARGSRRFCRPAALLLAMGLLSLIACSSSDSKDAGDDGAHDYVTLDYSFGDVPEKCSNGGANEKGVGATCTMGGNQCQHYTGTVCSCDPLLGYVLPPGSPCFCIIPIVSMPCDKIPANYCGSNATCCSYMATAAACVPTACLEPNMNMCPEL